MPEMKDSGIEWIGRIPSIWKTKKIKYIPNKQPDSFTDGDWIESQYITGAGIRYLTTGNIGDGYFKAQGDGYVSEETFVKLRCKYAYPGDLVISRLNEPYGRSCILPSDEANYVLAVDNVILRTNENKKYICYVTQCDGFHKSIQDKSAGTTMKRISRTNLGEIILPLPPLCEQNIISAYLDSKCSEIDTLRADIKEQIHLLEEYKKSVITEAVTKGLDPNVEMKDSGVEWIGTIPKKWSFLRITHIIDRNHPYPIGDGDHGSIKASDYAEDGIPFIRVQNLGFATELDLTNVVYITERQNQTIKNSTLAPDDILFAKTGATIGKVGIVPHSLKKANTTSHVGKITVAKSINPKYIFYFLSSSIGFKQFWDIADQKSTRPELSIDEIKGLRVILPRTKEEQDGIVVFLDNQCHTIDRIISKKKDQLSLLEDYKKSLIYEYVTGKKEVPADFTGGES